MFNLVAGSLLDIGGKLIDKLIPDPEAKAKAQQEHGPAVHGRHFCMCFISS